MPRRREKVKVSANCPRTLSFQKICTASFSQQSCLDISSLWTLFVTFPLENPNENSLYHSLEHSNKFFIMKNPQSKCVWVLEMISSNKLFNYLKKKQNLRALVGFVWAWFNIALEQRCLVHPIQRLSRYACTVRPLRRSSIIDCGPEETEFQRDPRVYRNCSLPRRWWFCQFGRAARHSTDASLWLCGHPDGSSTHLNALEADMWSAPPLDSLSTNTRPFWPWDQLATLIPQF